MAATPTVTPCGILEVASGQLSIGMIVGTTTSDSIVDTLEQWWEERKAIYPHVQTLMIDLDNGPDSHSHRTQFVHRITQFADSSGLRILLVYYPPYHSKYNPVERCWSALERHWNGALLTTIETSLNWVATMTNEATTSYCLETRQPIGARQEVDQESDETNQPATASPDWSGALVHDDPTCGSNDVTDAMPL